VLGFFTKKKAIDKRRRTLTISEAKKILEVSEKTVIRYINKTKQGKLDFPFRQYIPNGTYYIPINKLKEWIERKSGG
jgi:transposase